MTKLKQATHICALLVMLLCSGCHSRRDSFAELKQQIAVEDLEILEGFFDYLIKHTSSGFTLFGNKAVSYECYLVPRNEEEINGQNLRYGLLAEGWGVFQKYAHLFPNDLYSIGKTDHKPISCITIANKRDVKNKISEHLDLFKQFYGNNFSPDEYLDKLHYTFLEEDKLAGILLGFGTKSSADFHRKMELSYTPKDKLDNLQPSFGFATLEDELDYLQCHDTTFLLDHIESEFSIFEIPAFMAMDDDEEIALLAKSYTETLKVLHDVSSKYSCLQIFYEKCAGRL